MSARCGCLSALLTYARFRFNDCRHGGPIEARHVGTILSGTFAFEYPDGTRTELHAGDVYDMPPGHDGYVVGDEPVSTIEWGGVRAFNSFPRRVDGF